MLTKSKKVIAAAASACMVLTAANVPALAAGLSFRDVPITHWAYNYVETAADKGWVNGVGDGKYDPNGQVTGTEFVTMIVRAFYSDEITAQNPGDPWYAPYTKVATNNHLLTHGLDSRTTLEKPLSRYQMAVLISNTAYDQGIEAPEIETSEIGDWNQIPEDYQLEVKEAYALGLLVGNDDEGNFAGTENMTRAQAAVVMCRMADAFGVTDPVDPEDPETPSEDDPAEEPASGPVGTLSDTPVTLSYETHKPVTDYWSDAPADIRAITDQEAYNCAVQTLKDQDIIRDPSKRNGTLNEYYNYAMYHNTGDNQNQINVSTAVTKMNGYVGFGLKRVTRNSDGSSDCVFDATKRLNSENYDAVIDPILATLDDNMSDREKAEVLVQAIIDRFDYKVDTSFNWPDPQGSTGDCSPFAHAVNDIFNAAGLPCIWTSDATHAWNYAYLDGQWYLVDASAADVGNNIASVGIGTSIDSYHGGPNTTSQVAMALIESAFA